MLSFGTFRNIFLKINQELFTVVFIYLTSKIRNSIDVTADFKQDAR